MTLSEGSNGKSKTDSEIMYKIPNPASIVRSPADDSVGWFKLPANLKLMFFGRVGNSDKLCCGLCVMTVLRVVFVTMSHL